MKRIYKKENYEDLLLSHHFYKENGMEWENFKHINSLSVSELEEALYNRYEIRKGS